MSKHRKTVLYVAGPMTGIENHNIEAFNMAEHLLLIKGYTVLNPARHEQVEGRDWRDYMDLGIRDVLDADAVAVLPGWKRSRGALLEAHVAAELAKPIEPVDYWITHIN